LPKEDFDRLFAAAPDGKELSWGDVGVTADLSGKKVARYEWGKGQ
jgi:hypothetical protein